VLIEIEMHTMFTFLLNRRFVAVVILMYKTAVYRLVTHQKKQISEKGDNTQQYIS